MPIHAPTSSDTTYSSDLIEDGVACPLPLTPPPEIENRVYSSLNPTSERLTSQYARAIGPTNDNTASGMSMRQEDTLYLANGSISEKAESENFVIRDIDQDDGFDTTVNDDDDYTANEALQKFDDSIAPDTPVSMRERTDSIEEDEGFGKDLQSHTNNESFNRPDKIDTTYVNEVDSGKELSDENKRALSSNSGLNSIDRELDQHATTKHWDFSHTKVSSEYPSALFQPFSTYKGTQQSDKQIYNVEVTILTVNIEQSTLSGYLQICGLTPDHPTLTTFFTGDIIGGPNQKYSFRTSDPDWGANSKIDVTHWTRFPAWKPLSVHAKKDINFSYPLNHESWWQQEHIFMRWKEHFLVPDHKLKSIQGASFEGFYYICLNQVEGKISGIYFHSKSEKYQQLELKHEGKQGVWGNGIRPSVEFR